MSRRRKTIKRGITPDPKYNSELVAKVIRSLMRSGLHYATSRRISAERGHLDFRRNFLHELTDDPVVDELCDFQISACAGV